MDIDEAIYKYYRFMKLCISMMELHISVAFMELREVLWHMSRIMNLDKSNYRAPRFEVH